MNTLIFTEYKPSETTKSGKTAPAKAKSGSIWYALGKGIAEPPLHLPLVVDTSSKQVGQYTNHYLNKWTPYAGAGGATPETPPATTQHVLAETKPIASFSSKAMEASAATDGVPATPPPKNRASRVEPDVQRLIVRQSCLKAAVDFGSGQSTVESLLDTAELFVRWVFEEDAYGEGSEVNRGGDGGVSVPASPAQRHLADARQKAQDRRAEYEDSDAVCPKCGYKDWLSEGSQGWFCSAKRGGCGYPPRGERLDAPMSWGEFKQRNHLQFRRPDAQVVSPATHPSRPADEPPAFEPWQ